MTTTYNLKKLLETIRTISLRERLFGWKRIKDQLMLAAADLERLNTINGSLEEKANALSHQVDLLASKNENLTADRNRLAEANAHWRAEEEKRRTVHNEQMTTLKQTQDRIQMEREKEIGTRHQAEIDRLEKLKFTWHQHQEKVIKFL